MEKRLISALAISVLVILAFQYFTVKPPAPTAVPAAGEVAASKPAQGVAIVAPKPDIPTVDEKETIVETDRYILTFSNIGGSIKDIKLRDFKDQPSGEALELVRIKNQIDYIFNMSQNGANFKFDLAPYTLSRTSDSIIYTADIDGWNITKRYVLHKAKYGIELQISIRNNSGVALPFDYRIIGGAGVTDSTEEARRMIEVTASIDGKSVGYKRPKAGGITNVGNVKWAALKNKYFSVIVRAMDGSSGQHYIEDSSDHLVMSLNISNPSVQPGATVENKFTLYVGPSHHATLKLFGHGFEETINYGFFGAISKALIVVMGFFYSLFHSWGFAIILLSIFLNIILFPLTLKSFQSMQKMQALHPQMEKLKKLHKDNPQKLNKEIMELYKKYKINPFSGCLPMLLQMPIFIALYQALMKSIELRNTSFLWIQDLSSPDAVRLPITLPILGNSINILPLIMVGAMVVQQKMSSHTMGSAVTDEQKQQQKMMLILMPIMFGFIFYNMPSGLVLYWVVNTSLTIIEQMAIMKNTAVEA